MSFANDVKNELLELVIKKNCCKKAFLVGLILNSKRNGENALYAEFASKNIRLEPQFEFAVHDLLIRFASIHMGVACVVKEFSKESIDKGMVKEINLNPPLPARSVGYAHLKHSPLSLPARAFLELIKEKKDIR